MSQSRVNLATAKRELAERQDEMNLCMVELKHAQEVMAAGGTGPKVLSVTVQEVFGDITVDRVAVRPNTTPAQEKVVVEGIPCSFTLDAVVESFDLVLMAEDATDAGVSSAAPTDAAKAPAGVTATAAAAPAAPAEAEEAPPGEAGDGNETDSVLISAEDAAEAVEAEAEAEAVAAATSVVDEPEVERAGADEGELSPEVADASTADAEAAAAAAAVSEQTEQSQEELFHDADGSAEPATGAMATENLPTADTETGGSEPEAAAAAAVESKASTEEAAPMSGSASEELQVNGDGPASTGVAAETPALPVDGASAAGNDGSADADSTTATAGADDDDDGNSLAAALSLDTAAAETEAAAAATAAAATAANEAAAPEDERAAAEEGGVESTPAVAAPESAEEVEEVVAEATETDDSAKAETAPVAAAVSAAEALASTNGDVASASPETAAALGCSTGTIEVVVPSAELDFKLSQGQWRYLEADSSPVHGGDAVEVTKGVRFSTTLKAVDSREDDNRIVELSSKFDEAERAVRSAEAMIKKLQPAAAGTSSRKKSGATAGGRKSAMKKGKSGARAAKSSGASAGKRKGASGALTAAVGNAYGKAKTAGALVWGARNLFFFAAAVAAMHLHGDYLAV